MRSYEQVIPDGSPVGAIVLHRNPDRPDDLGIRVNWLFAGLLLGAASGLLVLGVVFAVLGEWIPTASLFAGLCLCVLAARGLRRQLRDVRNAQDHERNRAKPDASILP